MRAADWAGSGKPDAATRAFAAQEFGPAWPLGWELSLRAPISGDAAASSLALPDQVRGAAIRGGNAKNAGDRAGSGVP